MKILLLEDDQLFCETLVDFLQECEYKVDVATQGQEVLDKTFKCNYDLYILDINVPQINGLELLKLLRQSDDVTPAIFLTSYKDQETLLRGFECGADDYLRKPVDLDELSFRIQSLLRRNGKINKILHITPEVQFDPQKQHLTIASKRSVLPVKISLLLELLIQKKDSTITKEDIIKKLWSVEEDYSEGSIRVYINQLKKLLPMMHITNIKGVGYQIRF
ncbi:MAG: response regulator transcription factor [Campylobacterota bacterium]|nr:response regulator transcription factor [Campylobacterota bacterium]